MEADVITSVPAKEVSNLRRIALPDAIERLFSSMESNGIVYCHLKGNPRHMHTSLSGDSDLDILFQESQQERLEPLLAGLGFKRFTAVKQRRYEGVADFIAFDKRSCKLIHLHAHYKVNVGRPLLKEYATGFEELILANRQFREEFGTYCISPDWQLILLFLNEAFRLPRSVRYLKRNRSIYQKSRLEFAYLKGRADIGELNKSLQSVFHDPVGFSSILNQGLSSGTLLRLRRTAKNEFRTRRIYSPLYGLMLRITRKLYLGLVKRFRDFLSPIPTKRVNPRGGVAVKIQLSDSTRAFNLANELVNLFNDKLDVFRVDVAKDRRGRYQIESIRIAKRKGMLVICTGAGSESDLILGQTCTENSFCENAEKVWRAL